nr:hypothetical protein Iba_chr04eCG12720 [Ipomoea batatas]GMD70616.1 hypothetical protein Iba_chr12eCG8060 [Ipomoea batatas]
MGLWEWNTLGLCGGIRAKDGGVLHAGEPGGGRVQVMLGGVIVVAQQLTPPDRHP